MSHKALTSGTCGKHTQMLFDDQKTVITVCCEIHFKGMFVVITEREVDGFIRTDMIQEVTITTKV